MELFLIPYFLVLPLQVGHAIRDKQKVMVYRSRKLIKQEQWKKKLQSAAETAVSKDLDENETGIESTISKSVLERIPTPSSLREATSPAVVASEEQLIEDSFLKEALVLRNLQRNSASIASSLAMALYKREAEVTARKLIVAAEDLCTSIHQQEALVMEGQLELLRRRKTLLAASIAEPTIFYPESMDHHLSSHFRCFAPQYLAKHKFC